MSLKLNIILHFIIYFIIILMKNIKILKYILKIRFH